MSLLEEKKNEPISSYEWAFSLLEFRRLRKSTIHSVDTFGFILMLFFFFSFSLWASSFLRNCSISASSFSSSSSFLSNFGENPAADVMLVETVESDACSLRGVRNYSFPRSSLQSLTSFSLAPPLESRGGSLVSFSVPWLFLGEGFFFCGSSSYISFLNLQDFEESKKHFV